MKKSLVYAVLTLAILFATAGCKDEDKSGPDFKGTAAAINSPTGTVTDAETAKGVSEAFAEYADGSSMVPMGESATIECSEGGSISASGSETNATFNYNHCCEMDDCCFDGGGAVAMNVDGFDMCMSFDIEMSCMEADGPFQLDYCESEDGETWFVIEYEGSTFACSGYFDSGSGGEWTIRDANSEWNCEATCSGDECTGSCTDGTDTYEW